MWDEASGKLRKSVNDIRMNFRQTGCDVSNGNILVIDERSGS